MVLDRELNKLNMNIVNRYITKRIGMPGLRSTNRKFLAPVMSMRDMT